MGVFKSTTGRLKSAVIVKALDEAIASSDGLAEFLGCLVCLAIGAVLGTEVKLPASSDQPENEKIEEA